MSREPATNFSVVAYVAAAGDGGQVLYHGDSLTEARLVFLNHHRQFTYIELRSGDAVLESSFNIIDN